MKNETWIWEFYLASIDESVPDDRFREEVGRRCKAILGGYAKPDKFFTKKLREQDKRNGFIR